MPINRAMLREYKMMAEKEGCRLDSFSEESMTVVHHIVGTFTFKVPTFRPIDLRNEIDNRLRLRKNETSG